MYFINIGNTVYFYFVNFRWVTVTKMTRPRSAAGIVSFDGQIYALGGHDGLSIFDSVRLSR